MTDAISRFIELCRAAFSKEAMKKIVFSRPTDDGYVKISGRLCAHRGKRILAFEATVLDTVKQWNVKEDELSEQLSSLLPRYAQVNLITAVGDAEYKLGKNGAVILGEDKLMRRLNGAAPQFESAIQSLDRKKNYILDGKEEFLVKLGISAPDGRVHDKRQAKFRQINKFLEYVEDAYKFLPENEELIVYDLCCGKSYLSFALYYYLTVKKNRAVRMLGIDLNSDVIAFCDMTARELGFTGMTFVCDNVMNVPENASPHLVISLHACDVATDAVIASAIKLGARVILSTPCCHRNLSRKITAKELSFTTEFPKLSEKLCEAMTDALRLLLLRAEGYDVMATELTDPENTPKNTLLRAVKTGSKNERAKEEYDRTLKFLMGDKSDGYLPKF